MTPDPMTPDLDALRRLADKMARLAAAPIPGGVTDVDGHDLRAWQRQAPAAVLALLDRLRAAEADRDAARLRLLSAAGDDLCRLSQEEIKAFTSGAVKIPPEPEFIASCRRFHQQIAGEAGVLTDCLTLAQLVAENEKLRAVLQQIQETADDELRRLGAVPGSVVAQIEADARAALAPRATLEDRP